jgi:hypothetical protein
MNKLKLALTVLSIATIVWGIIFYADFQNHYELLQKFTGDSNMIWLLMGYFCGFISGEGIFLSGVLLLITWVIFIDTTLGESICAFVTEIKRSFQNKKGVEKA